MDVAVVPYKPIDDFFFSPMKLFESMAVGCPTVAADLGQIGEIVRHRKTGWLYPAGNTEKLTEGIEFLLEDQALASQIGVTARQYVLSHHTWSHVAGEVLRIAESILAT